VGSSKFIVAPRAKICLACNLQPCAEHSVTKRKPKLRPNCAILGFQFVAVAMKFCEVNIGFLVQPQLSMNVAVPPIIVGLNTQSIVSIQLLHQMVS